MKILHRVMEVLRLSLTQKANLHHRTLTSFLILFTYRCKGLTAIGLSGLASALPQAVKPLPSPRLARTNRYLPLNSLRKLREIVSLPRP